MSQPSSNPNRFADKQQVTDEIFITSNEKYTKHQSVTQEKLDSNLSLDKSISDQHQSPSQKQQVIGQEKQKENPEQQGKKLQENVQPENFQNLQQTEDTQQNLQEIKTENQQTIPAEIKTELIEQKKQELQEIQASENNINANKEQDKEQEKLEDKSNVP